VTEYLCTRKDFERARDEILGYLNRNHYARRKQLSAYKGLGIPYEAIELAILDLKLKGIVEDLYTLPSIQFARGRRPEYLGLTAALETHSVELPEGVVRSTRALNLVADYPEKATA
jgi:hypothetical protein